MTEQEAKFEAAKRERHKSKHMTSKRWAAVHNSVKGWHVALIDDYATVAAKERLAASSALKAGNVTAYVQHAKLATIAGILAAIQP